MRERIDRGIALKKWKKYTLFPRVVPKRYIGSQINFWKFQSAVLKVDLAIFKIIHSLLLLILNNISYPRITIQWSLSLGIIAYQILLYACNHWPRILYKERSVYETQNTHRLCVHVCVHIHIVAFKILYKKASLFYGKMESYSPTILQKSRYYVFSLWILVTDSSMQGMSSFIAFPLVLNPSKKVEIIWNVFPNSLVY